MDQNTPGSPQIPQNNHNNRVKERRQRSEQQQAEKRQQVNEVQQPETVPERQKQQFDRQPKVPATGKSVATVVAVGAVAFAIGSAGAFGYAQWRSAKQQDAITQLALQLATMQQDGATRNATPDLTTVAGMAADTTADAAIDTVADPEIVTVSAPVTAATTAPMIAPVLATPAETDSPTSFLVAAATAAATPATLTPETPVKTQEEKIAEVITGPNRNQMRMLTEGVVAGLYSVRAEDADGQSTRIALTARNAATAAAQLERLLADAAAKGDIDVPDGLATDAGGLDSQTLLFGVVQTALAQGNPDEVAASQDLSRAAFSASSARSEVVNGQRYYVVARGDSLAYIALQFYGDTEDFWRIYEANTDLLRNPNTLTVGQRLRIPAS